MKWFYICLTVTVASAAICGVHFGLNEFGWAAVWAANAAIWAINTVNCVLFD